MGKNNKMVQNVVKFGFNASDVASVKIFDTDFVLTLKNGKKVTLKDGAMLAMTKPDTPINFEDQEVEVGKILKWVGQVDLSGVFNTVQSTPDSQDQASTNDNPSKPISTDTDKSNTEPLTTGISTEAVTSSVKIAIQPLNDSILQLQQQMEQLTQQINSKNESGSLAVNTDAVSPANNTVPPAADSEHEPANNTVPPVADSAHEPANNTVPQVADSAPEASNNTIQSAATVQETPANTPSTSTTTAEATAAGVTPSAIASKDGGFLSGISPQWGALGALGALGGGSAGGGSASASAVPTIVSSTVVGGTVTLGPVISNNDLIVTAYDDSGIRLATASVDSTGSYTISLGKIYVGRLIISVASQGSAHDYTDEATGQSKNLSGPLYSVATITSGQLTKTVHVNPATQLAANDLIDTSNATPVFQSKATTQAIADKNSAVCKLIGLTDSDITTAVVITTVDSSGKAKTGNTLGDFLSRISAIEMQTGKTTDVVLYQISQQVSSNNAAKIDDTVLANTQKKLSAPTFTSKSTASVDENTDAQTIVYQASATSTTGFTYTLKSGGDNSKLSIDSATGAVRLLTPADYETNTSYAFTVVASLNDGSGLYSERSVDLSVVDKNDNAPVFTTSNSVTVKTNEISNLVIHQAKTVDSDGTLGNKQVIYSLKKVGDENLLTINAYTGEISLKQPPDTATKSNYSFTVVATNAAASDVTQTTEQSVVLTLESPNQKPSSISNTLTVDGSYYFLEKDAFTFIDVDTNPDYNKFQKIKISSLPAKGLLEYLNLVNNTWTSVTLNQEIATTELDNRQLRYSPKATSSANNYSFFLFKVSDGYAWSDQPNSMSINVNLLSPSFTSEKSSSIDENKPVSESIYTATAIADMGQISYSLKTTGDYRLLSIDSNGVVTLNNSADYETKTSYNFTVIATLNLDGSISKTEQQVTVAVNDLNDNPPVFTSSATPKSYAMSNGSNAIYTATSSDADGTAANGQVTYSLKDPSVGDASYLSIDPGSGVVSLNNSAPELSDKYDYIFTVRASNGNLSADQTVTIHLTTPNRRPISKDLSLTLDGSDYILTKNNFYFYDADSDPSLNTFSKVKFASLPAQGRLEYTPDGTNWSLVNLNDEIATSELASKHLRYRPQATSSANDYSYFTFKVSDGFLWSTPPNSVTINVNLLSPAFSSGANSSVDENTPVSTPIYTADAAAAKGQISYSLKPTGDAGALTINSITGEVTLNNSADYETKTSYTFTVVANLTLDSSRSSTEKTVTVNVNDLNDCPPVFTSSATPPILQISDGSKVIYTATTSDADITAAYRQVSYSLNQTGDWNLLSIDPGTGVVSLKNTFTQVAQKDYTFTVLASNSAANVNQTATQTVTIHLTAPNTPPTSANSTLAVDGSYFYFTSRSFAFFDNDTDASLNQLKKIQITNLPVNGKLQYSSNSGWTDVAVNQEISTDDLRNGRLRYSPQATASDSNYDNFYFKVSDGNAYSTTANQMSINLSLLSPGFTSGTSNSIDENTAITNPIYTAVASASKGQISYSLKPTDDYSLLHIDSSGAVKLRTIADYESKTSYTFTVVATLTLDSSSSSTEKTVTVSVNDLNDCPPVFTSNGQIDTFVISSGTAIYKAVTTDADVSASNRQVSYSLKDPGVGDASYLSIDPGSGVVSLNNTAPDLSLKSSYTFTVIASNNAITGNLSTEQTVTIQHLVASNNRPATSNTTININESGTYSFKLSDFNFSDPDTSDLNISTFKKIKITTLPATGALVLNNSYIVPGQEINVTDIPNIKFTYSQSNNVTSYANFSYQVSDGYLYSLNSGLTTFNVVIANRAPTYSAQAQSRDILEESNVLNTVISGVPSATRTYVITDPEGDSIFIDTTYLSNNGWVQDSGNAASYSKLGKYGTLSFNISYPNSFVANYLLNNADPDTQALKPGDKVSEDPFYIQVSDNKGNTTLVPVQFDNIKGAKDVVVNNPTGINFNFADTIQFDTFPARTGNLLAIDNASGYPDVALSIIGATRLASLVDGIYDQKYTTPYGDFFFDSTGADAGKYKFVSNDNAINSTTPLATQAQRDANGGYDYKTNFVVSVSATGVSSVNIPINVNITSALDTPQISPSLANTVYANRIQSWTATPSMFGINNLNSVSNANLKISITGLSDFVPTPGRDTYLNTNYFYFNDRSNITNVADGASPTGGVTESSVVTFGALTAGQSVTVGGLTYTSTNATTAANVATAFANYASGTAVNTRSSSFGTFTGTPITGFNSGSVSGGTNVTFTSTTPTANVTDLSISTTGPSLTVSTTQGVAPSTNETATVAFFDMSSGDTVTVSNLTFTANRSVSANDVAALFRGKAYNVTPTTALGTFSGNLNQWNSTADTSTNSSQVTFKSNAFGDLSPIVYKNKISNFTLADVNAARVSFYDGSEATAPSFTATVKDNVNGLTSNPVTATSTFAAPGSMAFTPNGQNLKSGNLIYGDASGGGSATSLYSGNFSDPGTNGSAGPDNLTGTPFEDIIFGDGSGGGAGGTQSSRVGRPGFGGGAADNISAGEGNDIVFGDGFSGSFADSVMGLFSAVYGTYSAALVGTNGGYGGGGGGGARAVGTSSTSAGLGGIGGGDGYGTVTRPLLSTDLRSGSSDLRGSPSTVGVSRVDANTFAGGGGGGVSATGSDDTNAVTAGLDQTTYNKVMADLNNTGSDIYKQVMGAGNDTLDGGAGNDWIMAGFGNDLITGGSGNDTMWGRGGANTSSQHNTLNLNGTASAPESVALTFVTGDVLNTGNTLSYGGLTITALSDLNAQDLTTALSNISLGGSGTSVANKYNITGTLLSGWSSSTYTSTVSDKPDKFTYTFTFKNNVNGNIDVSQTSLQAAITTYNMSDNDTFQWNAGDASAGRLSTDTIKDFKAWDGSSGDKIDISGLLRGLGYQAGTSTLSDWVMFTPAIGSSAAKIDIDTGAGTNVIQTIVLENANMNGYSSLTQLINNGVLVA